MLEISNPVRAPIRRGTLVAVGRAFQRCYPAARGGTIGVILADRRTSRRLNRTFRGRDEPTDVLSFPARDRRRWPAAGRLLGEVVICYPVAIQQAKRYGHSVRREVAELLVHGLAHLAGYDHGKPAQAKRMAEFEAKILASAFAKW